ncbi:MAG: hypothetical protein L0Y64_01885, partial [Myxococcaceae bacterium]|nr:hypothetical protein [Myxococcaceae bacterium]
TWTGGLSTPESVVHDARADLYYVSNIHGGSLDVDNNGFISRLSPDGKVLEAKWISGGVNGVKLHAPKGMALAGDTLYVADIDTVRKFHRRTGAPTGEVTLLGATFLNDVAVGQGGVVFVSDSGPKPDASGAAPSGTGAVYRIGPSGKVSQLASGPELGRPNGLLFARGKLWVVTALTGELYSLDTRGKRRDATRLPSASLDGLVQVGRDFIVSSWEGQALYRGRPGGSFRAWVSGLTAPADIGFDAVRRRVLVPRFRENRVEAYDVR